MRETGGVGTIIVVLWQKESVPFLYPLSDWVYSIGVGVGVRERVEGRWVERER